MCGRYTHLFSWKELRDISGAVVPAVELKRRYNVCPTQTAPVVRVNDKGIREGAILKWGLVPSWAKEVKIGASLNNARAETVASKPSFRTAFKKRRCLVPVSGMYEWQKREGEKTGGETKEREGNERKEKRVESLGEITGGVPSGGEIENAVKKRAAKKSPPKKQPFYIYAADGTPLFFAGLWESWLSPDGSELETFCIVTTEANAFMAAIHDRMPVILEPAQFEEWLRGSPEQAALLMRPCSSSKLKAHPVSTLVNVPKNDVEQCIQPLAGVW